jgi:hypothetical protein
MNRYKRLGTSLREISVSGVVRSELIKHSTLDPCLDKFPIKDNTISVYIITHTHIPTHTNTLRASKYLSIDKGERAVTQLVLELPTLVVDAVILDDRSNEPKAGKIRKEKKV